MYLGVSESMRMKADMRAVFRLNKTYSKQRNSLKVRLRHTHIDTHTSARENTHMETHASQQYRQDM